MHGSRVPLALALALAVAPVLAGCIGAPKAPLAPESVGDVSSTAGGVFHVAHEVALAVAPKDFPLAVGGEYRTGFDATEPTLGVTKDGAVFMTAEVPNPDYQAVPTLPYAGIHKGPSIVRSLDHGQSWSDVYPKLPTGDSVKARTWDPYVYVDSATDRVFMDDIFPISCGALSFSDDKGATWTTNPYSCGNTQVNDHQTLVAAKPRMLPTVGYPDVVYRCVNDLVASACAMSYDGGLTFTPQVPAIDMARDNCGGLTGHLRAGPDGTVYLPKADCPGGPLVAYTQNDGLTWDTFSIPTKHAADDHELGFAVDAKGGMYAVWVSEGELFYSASIDHGKTWLPERNVTAPGVTAVQYDAVAVGDPGKVAIAYIGTTIPKGYKTGDLYTGAGATPLDDGPENPAWANATWNAYMGVMLDATRPDAPIQTVTLNDAANPLARGVCGHTRCHGMNDFIELVIDHDGRPWGSFVDVCNDACVKDPTKHFDYAMGFVGTLRGGPGLAGANATLALLLPAPAAPKVVPSGSTFSALAVVEGPRGIDALQKTANSRATHA